MKTFLWPFALPWFWIAVFGLLESDTNLKREAFSSVSLTALLYLLLLLHWKYVDFSAHNSTLFVRLLNYMESSRWLILVVLAYLWNQAGRTIFFLQKSLSKNQLSLFPKRVCIVCDIFYNNFLTKLGNRKQLARGTIYHQNAVGISSCRR